jgi:small subunit ribosomal protein S17
MAEIKEKTKKKESKEVSSCADKICPVHAKNKIKLRGRTFEGYIIKKFEKRVVIQFERTLYVRKYERYEKRKTKLHARLPECIREEMDVGDYIQIRECRPISKIIHFVVVKKIRGKDE